MLRNDPTQSMRPQASAHPVRTATAVIYATLLLLILTIPQSLPNWLRDTEETPVQQALLAAAESIRAVSNKAGLDVVYVRARTAFFRFAGKEDE